LQFEEPEFIDTILDISQSKHSVIEQCVKELVKTSLECLKHCTAQEYITNNGNREIWQVVNIRKAPCFWPTPFQESSNNGIRRAKKTINEN
jgi:hypothetical protein